MGDKLKEKTTLRVLVSWLSTASLLLNSPSLCNSNRGMNTILPHMFPHLIRILLGLRSVKAKEYDSHHFQTLK